MQITRQADYAVLAVLYLAQLGQGGRATTSQIAREQHIPATFLAKIVSQLSASGIVRAIRGANGGVMLAKPTEEITLLEVVEVIDGPITLNACVTESPLCPVKEDCPLHDVWQEAQATLVAYLSKMNFALLVERAGTRVDTGMLTLQVPVAMV